MAYKKLNFKNSKISKFLIRRRRLFCYLFILLAVLNLVCFFILPPLLKKLVEKKLSQKINRSVTIDKIRINPYAFSVDVKDLFIYEPDNREIFCYAKQLFVDINLSSLFRFAPIINEMKLVKPYFNVVREDESLYNFSDIITKDNPSEKPLKFFVGNIVVNDCRIVFSDKPKEKKHLVRKLNLSFPFISNFPAFINTYTSPSFSAEINGSFFTLKGKTKLFSDTLETYFDIDISKFSIPEYLVYVPVPLKFKPLSAYLEGNLCLSYINSTKGKQSLSINGDLTFSDISISGIKDNPVLDVSSVGIDISSIEFFSRQAELSQIKIISPSFILSKEKVEELSSYQDAPVKEAKKQKNGPPSFVFNIKNIILSGGKFSFTDRTLETSFHTVIDSVNCNVEDLSNEKDQLAHFQLSAKSETGETLSASGDVGLTPFLTEGKVELDRIIINKYVAYYGRHILFDVAEGVGSISGVYKYFPGENNLGLTFSGLSLSLKGLKVEKKGGTTFLETPLFSLLKTDVNIKEKKVNVGSCNAESISLKGTKGKDGTINFLPLFPTTSKETKSVVRSDSIKWAFSIGNIKLNKSSFYLTDNSPVNPAYIGIENLSAKIVDFFPATDKRSPFELVFTLNEKGKISADGHFTSSPLSATFRLNTSDIQVMPIQPYISEKLNIIVTGGSFSSVGNVSLIKPKDKNVALVYKGNASMQNFVSIDGQYGDTFVKWSNLALQEMNIGVNPVKVAVEDVNLKDFDANVIIHSDNVINILNAVKKEKSVVKKEDKKANKGKRESSGSVYIGKVGVKNAKINFIDKSVEPNYFTTIDNLEGSLKGVSSMKKEPASLDVIAKIGGDTNLVFTGGLRPLKEDFFLDMKVALDGMDLTSATPYSGKYLGYTTRKGRLVLDLDYLIEKNKLQSQNRFIFDQLILGEKVESKSATKLPVKFAIALLKDLSGKISIDLPVSGYIDDPKFRIGPIIMKMFVNLITKAAVSPFTLLGAIFGGGEEISYLEYDYGTMVIKPEGEKKLNILVKMLKERPGLNLEIEGFVDKVKDTEVLRQNLFLKKVKMEKLKESVKKGEESIPVEDILLTQEEYQHYLWLAYKNETFPRPKNVLGQVKELPISEMEESILEHIKITNDDLRHLATSRGEAVKNYLVKHEIASDRIFLLEPRVTLVEKKSQELKASRVDFRLK